MADKVSAWYVPWKLHTEKSIDLVFKYSDINQDIREMQQANNRFMFLVEHKAKLILEWALRKQQSPK